MKTDINDHTSGRVGLYEASILEYLKEHGLATKDELDDLIFNKFSNQFTPEDLGPVLNRKGQVLHEEKWRNDVDWVKAGLTRNHVTMTIGDLVILLPDVKGHVNGVGVICTRSEAAGMAAKIVRKLL